MQTVFLPVDPDTPEINVIRQAAAVLRKGGLLAFPTETVYGLGANAADSDAVARIFAAKGRPAGNPLIVHVFDVRAARELVVSWPDEAKKLAARFWPGPLTIVLAKTDRIPAITTGGGSTVGIRVPAHPVARSLLHETGLPIAAPSANLSNRLSPTLAEHVRRDMDGRIEMVLVGGATSGGLESTVVDLSVHPPRLLRPGLLSPQDIEAEIGPLERAQTVIVSGEAPLPAPGLLSRHYAPRAVLECIDGDSQDRAESLCRRGVRVGWLTTSGLPSAAEQPGIVTVVLPDHPAGYAAGLYAALHALDDAGVERIVVSLPPATDAWLAIRDRLLRGRSAG